MKSSYLLCSSKLSSTWASFIKFFLSNCFISIFFFFNEFNVFSFFSAFSDDLFIISNTILWANKTIGIFWQNIFLLVSLSFLFLFSSLSISLMNLSSLTWVIFSLFLDLTSSFSLSKSLLLSSLSKLSNISSSKAFTLESKSPFQYSILDFSFCM